MSFYSYKKKKKIKHFLNIDTKKKSRKFRLTQILFFEDEHAINLTLKDRTCFAGVQETLAKKKIFWEGPKFINKERNTTEEDEEKGVTWVGVMW